MMQVNTANMNLYICLFDINCGKSRWGDMFAPRPERITLAQCLTCSSVDSGLRPSEVHYFGGPGNSISHVLWTTISENLKNDDRLEGKSHTR